MSTYCASHRPGTITVKKYQSNLKECDHHEISTPTRTFTLESESMMPEFFAKSPRSTPGYEETGPVTPPTCGQYKTPDINQRTTSGDESSKVEFIESSQESHQDQEHIASRKRKRFYEPLDYNEAENLDQTKRSKFEDQNLSNLAIEGRDDLDEDHEQAENDYWESQNRSTSNYYQNTGIGYGYYGRNKYNKHYTTIRSEEPELPIEPNPLPMPGDHSSSSGGLLPVPKNEEDKLPSILNPVDDIENWEAESYFNGSFLEKSSSQNDDFNVDYNDLLRSYKDKKIKSSRETASGSSLAGEELNRSSEVNESASIKEVGSPSTIPKEETNQTDSTTMRPAEHIKTAEKQELNLTNSYENSYFHSSSHPKSSRYYSSKYNQTNNNQSWDQNHSTHKPYKKSYYNSRGRGSHRSNYDSNSSYYDNNQVAQYEENSGYSWRPPKHKSHRGGHRGAHRGSYQSSRRSYGADSYEGRGYNKSYTKGHSAPGNEYEVEDGEVD